MSDSQSGHDGDSVAVVLIAHPSADLYGSDRVMLETIEAIVSTGRKVVVTMPADGPLSAEIVARGGSVEIAPTLVLRKNLLSPTGIFRLIGQSIRGVSAGIRTIRRHRPELVIVNTLTIPAWMPAARLTRTRVICHVHEAERGASRLVRRGLTAPLLLAHRIVANSQFTLDVLTESFRSLGKRSQVIYNAVPGPVDVDRRRSVGPLRVLYMGRLSPRKGVDVAVEAVAALRSEGVDASIDLVGDVFPGYEWYRDELMARAAESDLAGAVRFHGFQGDIWPFVADTDAVVVPSRLDEPFGNTAVEAVLGARPVIVSDSSGLREAAGGYESAQKVTPDDPATVAAALRRIDADRDGFFDAALRDRDVAIDRHGPARYAASIVALLGDPVTVTR